MKSAEKPVLIMFSLFRWDDEYSSTAISLVSSLQNDFRVYCMDYPFSIKDFVTEFSSERMGRRKSMIAGRSGAKAIEGTNMKYYTPRLTLPINWISNKKTYEIFRKYNEGIVYRSLKKLLQTEKISSFYFLNVFSPFYGLTFPASFKPSLHLYYSVDNMAESEYVKKHGPYLEEAYARKADTVLATSSTLKNKMSQFTDNVELLANAADFTLFNKAAKEELRKPHELSSMQKPVVIYTGNICDRINYDLLIEITRRKDELTLVMVGPVNTADPRIQELKRSDNVHFAGRKNLDELPAFLQYADCAIIPFKMNDLTASIYPLKVNEYLASGIPVVSTPFSQDLMSFADVVALRENPESFVDGIIDEIRQNSDEKRHSRILKASQNTWQKRAEEFKRIIRKYENS
jgi:glycosyltransferase involved in cell wall biosynthesis